MTKSKKRVAAGRKGGKKTVAKYGKSHMKEIGVRGGKTTKRLCECGKKKGCK